MRILEHLKKIFPLLFLTLINVHLKGQYLAYTGDSVYLSLNGLLHGSIQWQESEDTVTWIDIPGATYNLYPIMPDANTYYRAKVVSGSCNPLYSDISKVIIKEFQCGDTFMDIRDGQKYPTVKIGNQCWFAKNLNAGEYIKNGSKTPSDNSIIEKYCYNNDTNNCKTYGGLYDWNEMMQYTTDESTRGVCPAGWHIPSDSEWMTLETALGMDPAFVILENAWRGDDEGKQLKAGGSSGFNALLSGNAIPGGFFNAINLYEYVYTSTQAGEFAWRRCVRTGDNTIGRWNTFPKNYALSVRCVKN